MHKNLSHIHPKNFPHYLEAGLEQTPNRKLRELADHGHSKVRARVAENAKTPVLLLAKLAEDPAVEVRIAVAQNPAITAAIRLRLITDDDANVRYAIAEDVTVPIEILSLLTADDHPYVSHRAHRTLEKVLAAGQQSRKKESPKERLLRWRKNANTILGRDGESASGFFAAG